MISSEEKAFIEKIQSIDCIDKNLVVDVFKAIQFYITKNAKTGKNEFVIPYIGRFTFEFYDKITSKGKDLQIKLDGKAQPHLIEEVNNISEGEDLICENRIKNDIKDKICEILDVV